MTNAAPLNFLRIDGMAGLIQASSTANLSDSARLTLAIWHSTQAMPAPVEITHSTDSASHTLRLTPAQAHALALELLHLAKQAQHPSRAKE